MHSLPNSYMELCMELLSQPWLKTMQELIESCELFYGVWNVAAHMPQNCNMDNINVDAVKYKPISALCAPKQRGSPEPLGKHWVIWQRTCLTM